MTVSDTSRVLQWDACLNVRDLGGLPAHDGATTRWGALVRADTLCRLTPAGCRALVEHGIRTIVDLRFSDEVARAPHPFGSPSGFDVAVRYVNVPVTTGRDPERFAELAAAFATVRTRADANRLEIDANPRWLAAIATTIAQAPIGGVLVHCHAGKDRTGIVVALLLALIGVPYEVIAADYALSSVCLQRELERWLAEEAPDDPDERERQRQLQLARPEVMMDTLTYLAARHGGAEAYLQAGGVGAADLAALRERLVG